MDINNRLFFEDGSDLAEAGAIYSREIAEAGEEAALARTSETLALANEANDKEAQARRGANTLSDELTSLRREHEALIEAYYRQAFFDADTVDHTHEAEASAKRSQVISAITGALEFGRESLAPGLRLAVLKAAEIVSRESAQLASWTALKSAVNRHELSAPLAGVEGGVSYGTFGKTHDLLMAQLGSHKRASEASEAVLKEEQRQRARKEIV